MSDDLTVYQQHFIELGYIYRSVARKMGENEFWQSVKKTPSLLMVLESSYKALLQIKQVIPIEEFKEKQPDQFAKYDAWARKFNPPSTEKEILKIIQALYAFKYFKDN